MLASDPIVADLIDRTYEAAFTPGAWPELLDRIGHMAESQGCLLLRFGASAGPWTASEGMERLMRAYFADGFSEDRSITGQLLHVPGDRFYSDHAMLPADLRATSRFYREFLHPNNADYMAASHVRMEGQDPLVVIITRKRGAPPVEDRQLARLTALHGHLGRAAALAGRMEAERVRGAIAAFSMAGFAACAVDADGVVLEANERMAAVRDHAFTDAQRILRLCHPPARMRLAALLSGQAGPDGARAGGGTIPMPSGPRHSPAVAHVIPVRHERVAVFARAAAFVIIVPVADTAPPQGELMQGLFDLSPSEARILGLLASCMDVGQIAEALNISRDTVRFHLKNIFSKTGVSRQVDLAARLAAIPAFAWSAPDAP